MSNPGLICATAFLLASSMIGCGKMQEPNFRTIDNVSLATLGTVQSAIRMDVHYFNPNKSKLVLKHAKGDAWLDGIFLGTFIMDSLVHIPANSEFSVPVHLALEMKNFLTNSALVYADKEILVKIEGIATVGRGGIFIKYPIHYEGTQNLREFLKQ